MKTADDDVLLCQNEILTLASCANMGHFATGKGIWWVQITHPDPGQNYHCLFTLSLDVHAKILQLYIHVLPEIVYEYKNDCIILLICPGL